jgi:hypothetical protein
LFIRNTLYQVDDVVAEVCVRKCGKFDRTKPEVNSVRREVVCGQKWGGRNNLKNVFQEIYAWRSGN